MYVHFSEPCVFFSASVDVVLLDRGWKEFYRLALEHREVVRKKVEQAIEKRNRKAKLKAITVWRVSAIV